MTTHTLFNHKSELYEAARPLYPQALFEYLSQVTHQHTMAWDCACGNGQAAVSLVRFFDLVKATDVSEPQVSNAKQNDKIEYSVSPSESTRFPDQSFDLVCVAQALHWFDFERYWKEVDRVLKPNGIFAAWGYTWPSISPDIDTLFQELVLNVIKPYWAKENQLLWNHYKEVNFPFEHLDVPKMDMKMEWTLDEFFTFVRTFSASRLCIEDQGQGFFDRAYQQVSELWGAPSEKRTVNLDFVCYVGRKKAPL